MEEDCTEVCSGYLGAPPGGFPFHRTPYSLTTEAHGDDPTT